jgi:hypothetical protein
MSQEEIAEYERERELKHGQGLSIDEWLARPTENFLILAYRIREANRD